MTHMEDKEQRARAAKEALNNPAIMAALAQLEQDAIEAWQGTDLSDREKREISYFQQLGAVQLLQTLKNWSRDTERKGDK